MATGPGKYDEETTALRRRTRAEAVVVIVLNGHRGTGFSVQAVEDISAALPDLLEHVARAIREAAEPAGPEH